MDPTRSRPPLAIFNPKADSRKVNRREELKLENVKFTVHKFNNRAKPIKTDRVKIISCFSEFGCETVGCMYSIPRLLRRYPGQYIIAMGWHGREYLYRHLVDEFWEIDEQFMWLRDYTRAFHHVSDNLKKLEEAATLFGQVVPSVALGKYAVSNMCRTCGKFWNEWRKQAQCCPMCKSTVLVRSIFTDIASNKPTARKIPRPSQVNQDWAREFVGDNTVGIFARGRKTYGRNLPSDFYIKLIAMLEDMGYGVVWLGEKQTTQPCPVKHVVDFSRSPDARDLEKTLAIICNLKFTIQFWTASSRLSGMMGTPFLLFESPEQIYASYSGVMGAQEGKRLELTSFGPKKIVVSHYRSVLENQADALELTRRAIDEMNSNNWEDIIGMVENPEFSKQLQEEFYEMLT